MQALGIGDYEKLRALRIKKKSIQGCEDPDPRAAGAGGSAAADGPLDPGSVSVPRASGGPVDSSSVSASGTMGGDLDTHSISSIGGPPDPSVAPAADPDKAAHFRDRFPITMQYMANNHERARRSAPPPTPAQAAALAARGPMSAAD
jgi:hypothetical protein